MNRLAQLRQVVLGMDAPKRFSYLQSVGIPDREIPDLLNFMLSEPLVTPRQENRESNRMAEALKRIELRQQELAKNPPPPMVDGLLPFEKDVLHNRYLLGGASLHDGASFHNPKLTQTSALQWFRNEFLPSGVHFALILGKPGCGKTFAALAYVNLIAKVRIEMGKIQESNARYVHAYRLAEMLHDFKKNSNEIDAITKCGVLLLDDLGSEPTGWRGDDLKAHLGYLIDNRYRFKKKTIITTNAKEKEFAELYGERIISRFAEVGMFYQTQDPDLRKGMK